MNVFIKIWQKLPIIVRAIIIGLLVLLAGNIPWTILVGINIELSPSIPWAVLVTVVYLWIYWRYLNGKGKPHKTSDTRKHNFRANRLSGKAWLWSILAGVTGIISLELFSQLYLLSFKIDVPSSLPDLSQYPSHTIIAFLLMTSVVAGIVEEGAFRGYMQKPIEEKHGPWVAILIVGIVFGLSHFTHASMTLLLIPTFLASSVFYGSLAYITNSIIPGMCFHAAGDAITLFILWAYGTTPAGLLGFGKSISPLLISALTLVLIILAIATFRNLKIVVMKSRNAIVT